VRVKRDRGSLAGVSGASLAAGGVSVVAGSSIERLSASALWRPGRPLLL